MNNLNNDEEEKKKREEEARAIISSASIGKSINSINYANDNNLEINVQNAHEQNFINKVNEANSIINSINPREDVPAPSVTDEEKEKGHQNAQRLLDLMDNGKSTVDDEEEARKRIRAKMDAIWEDDTQQQENSNLATPSQREAVNVLINKNKPTGLLTNKEKEQQELEKQQAIKNAEEANSDTSILSQIGKNIENLWLGSVSGVKEFVRYLTNPNHTSTQEAELSSGIENNRNIPREVSTTYRAEKNQENSQMLINAQEKKTPLIKLYLDKEDEQKANDNILLDDTTAKNLDSTLNEYRNNQGEIELNPVQRTLENSIAEDQTKIASNTNKISNPILKKTSELLPSTGNSLTGAGLSMINPYLGMSYFIISASGSYETDGRNRGMSKEEARAYGSIMGFAEGATEMIGIDKFIKAGSSLRKGAFREALKNYGLDMADNAIQESVIDPIDELAAGITSGKTKNDYSTKEGWEQLGVNMIQDGIDGALSSLLMNGIGMSIDSSTYLYNKIRNNPNSVTEQDIKRAYTDIQNNPDINVEKHFKNSFEYEKDKLLNTDNNIYTIVNTNEQGNINLVQAMGEKIPFNNNDININPVVVYDNEPGYYNVIDGDTGTRLDTTPYSSKQEAINSFNDKISNVDNATINTINNSVAKTRIALVNKAREIDSNGQDVANQFYVRTADNQVYSTEDLRNINTNNQREYTREQYKDITNTINNISDSAIYNSTAANRVFDTVSNNIENVEVIEQSGNRYINSLNNEGRVVYQQKLNNRPYTGKRIKSIVNTAIKNADTTNLYQESNTNNAQTSQEPKESNFYSNLTNYAVQDINKVTEPFSKQESYSKDEMAEVWNNEVSDNNYDAYYDSNGNIERYIAIEEEGKNIVVNQYDNNDNIVRSAVIPSENGRYNNEDIRDTILKVSSNIDLSPYIKEMAYNFQDDLANTLPGERYKAGDTWTGQKRATTRELADIKDETGASWSKIGEVLDDIASGRKNNTKLAKIIEQKLDEALSEGYTNIYEKNVLPNDEYLEQKSKVYGRNFNILTNNDYDPTEYMTDEDFRIFGMKKVNKKAKSSIPESITKELHNKIQHAISNKNSRGKTNLGIITTKTANKIEKITGIEVNNRKHILLDNDIRHMLNQHSDKIKEAKKGQIAITSKDIEKIPDIINNYDRIIKGTENTKGEQSIRYTKKYDNKRNYVVEIVPKDNNNLIIKTMWIKPIRVINSQQTPNLTSKTKPKNGNTTSSNNSIAQKTSNVKNNTAISKSMQNNKNNTSNGIRSMKQNANKVTDSKGRTLTKQQQEYFKDSKVRDENGNLLVMYHGTEANVGIPENYWFTIFDIDKAGNHGNMLGNGFYFTSDRSHAEQYSHTKGNIYETYLNIKNPLELANFSTGELVYAIRYINPYAEADIYKRDGTIDGYKVRRYLLDNGYDGVHSGNTYVAFNSNQIKNITNSSPTSNDDIRYMKKNNSKNQTKTNTNTKNLIAQHNTSEEKLIEALDLGALPVPSIAITKSNTPISNYGDITLLFNKDTINPTDRRNVAYNSDIYSTRRPQTVNSLDKSKVKTFEKSMNNKGISYGYISQIEEYIQDNDFTRAKDTIRYELQKVNPDITEQEIEDSFTEAMGIIKDKRILKEGVDPYTPSGNRKSIEQMSVPYTLDNIVRLMTKKSNKGSESGNFAGLPEVRANLSQQFKNIEEMHQQENNLVSTEEMQKIKEQLNDKFYNLIDEIGKYDKVERYFGSADVVANALNETAKAKNISKEVLENELDFVSITNVPDKTLQKAIDFLNSLKNVPTEYFEVKPQRAVGLNEIQSAIVPKNTSKELIDKLKENNIPITYYDTEQERSKLIANEAENKNIRFAKKTAKPKNEEIEPGATNAQRDSAYIEQEIRKIEQSGTWDDSIPVTRMTDIRKTIEDYLGMGVKKGHFRQQAYAIYKGNRDVIRSKELKDIDSILHEAGHALDIGKRINLNKEGISNELLKAVNNYGGYEAETRDVQLEEGFAEVIREYTIVPNQAKIDYPQTVSVIEGIRQTDKDFNKFITDVQQQTYNYIHQNPENRVLSNQSIGERTDQTKLTPAKIQQEVMRNIYDKDWALKSAVNEMQKINGKTTNDLKASENAYYLTRLSSGIGDKIVSMLSKGYIDENGNKLMPGLESLGEILGNNEQRFNDLRAYLVAQRDLEYKAKTLKTGIRTMDSKAVVEQFKNDTQIQEAAKLVYDTLDGVMQYAVNNGLIDQEAANDLKESNAFYVPMQRVLEKNKNNVGRRGAVSDIIKARTGSELDVKDVLENIVANSANIIQQVENNNILRALYNQGEQAGMTGRIYDVIDTPMVKIGTAKLSTWERELRNQGVDTTELDLEKTIDLFAPNNKVDTNNLITSFINTDGKRVYLQFNDEVLFNSLMNMDKKFMSAVLNINRKINMPLRYGATMANIGFAIPNMISDTAQAAIFSEAGFIPVVDNVIGIMDILSAQNKTARNFFNKVVPGYADRINTLYAIYEQTGSTSSTRMSQYREVTQNLMKDVYGTKNSEVLGIKEKYKPLKRLLDIMTYIPELSEQSTRFRIFEKNLDLYRKKGMAETDARIQAALQSRDATQDFGRTGNITREINQLIPFSAARVGSAYTFAEKIKANPKRVATRMAVLMAISMVVKAIGYDDDEIEELNQRKKDDNFVLKIGDQIVTIKKPQGILRSIINLGEYVQDLFTGHIEEGKEGERLTEWVTNAIMDNMPADSVTGLVPNMIAPVVENAINKDLYYNSDIVKSYDLELPDSEQYYDYNSQLAIWLGQIFNYSPAKIDNLISGYFAGLGTSVTNVIDWIAGKTGITTEQPDMGAEDNAVGKRFIVNVNSNSQSVDEIYDLKTELKKKENGGTITEEEQQQLETITEAINEMSKLNKQIKEIKKDLTMSGKEKADQIKILQQQKTDTARQALGKDLLYSENAEAIESTKFYPSRDTLSQNKRTLTMTSEMKKEYEQVASEYYQKYEKQGLYSDEKLEQIKEKAKDYAKSYMMKKYKSELVKSE